MLSAATTFPSDRATNIDIRGRYYYMLCYNIVMRGGRKDPTYVTH